MKTIGFIDYYISEWHANNYPRWIKEVCEKTGKEFIVKYAWAEKEISEVDGKSTDTWCEEFGVEKCASIEEVCQKSDYVIILAPSNPEKHLEYAKKALPFAKRTYIDKTFASNLEEGKEIYALADKYGAKFFSTSALRFAEEVKDFNGDAKAVFVTGPGKTVDEYIIHLVENTVRCMGIGAKKVYMQKNYNQRIFTIDYGGEKKASLFFQDFGGAPHSLTVTDKDDKSAHYRIEKPFFPTLIEKILNFFETGELPFEREQTLEVLKIRDGILASMKKEGQWIEL